MFQINHTNCERTIVTICNLEINIHLNNAGKKATILENSTVAEKLVSLPVPGEGGIHDIPAQQRLQSLLSFQKPSV